jgi:hypothetical protein
VPAPDAQDEDDGKTQEEDPLTAPAPDHPSNRYIIWGHHKAGGGLPLRLGLPESKLPC